MIMGVDTMKKIDKILLGHGSGGELWHDLLEHVILPRFPDVQTLDGALLAPSGREKIVLTTDTYVVNPIFFSGGNIGSLAVNGCINDLAMMGARPVALSCGLILEEGFLIEDLTMICKTMFDTAQLVGMKIVTGDTKVVGRDEADKIYINTTGIGFASLGLEMAPGQIQPGDAIIINGGIGEHGTVILAHRYSITFQPELTSDTAPLWPAVSLLLKDGLIPRVMRDLTRGGLASALYELSTGFGVDFIIEEQAITIDPRVKQVGDVLGIEPFDMACEGRFVLIVPSDILKSTLSSLRENGFPDASHIGNVTKGTGKIILRTEIGSRRIRPLTAELIPRIC